MPKWIPDLASPDLEERMETGDVPEDDRDEVRRFAEFLRRCRDQRDGKELPAMPEGMREWLAGCDLEKEE